MGYVNVSWMQVFGAKLWWRVCWIVECCFFLFVLFLRFVASFASPSRLLLLVAVGVSCSLFVFICLLFAVVGPEEWMHFDFVSGLLPWSLFIIVIIVVIFVFIIDAMTITTVSVILIHTKTCLSLNIISSDTSASFIQTYFGYVLHLCLLIFETIHHNKSTSLAIKNDFHTDEDRGHLGRRTRKGAGAAGAWNHVPLANRVEIGAGKAVGKR